MDPFSIASLGLGLVGGIGQLFGTGSANKKLEELQAKNDALADSRLGLAKTLLNSRMPGQAETERNIFSNQASQIGNINRTATSSNEALLAGAGAQGQTNEALNKLGIEDKQDYQRRYGNLNQAQDAKLQSLEGDAQLQGAQAANKYNTWGNISNLGFGLADFGMAGGFKNMFGKGDGANLPSQRPAFLSQPVQSGLPNSGSMMPQNNGLAGNPNGIYINPRDLNAPPYNGYGSQFWLNH